MTATTRKINWNTDPLSISEPLSSLVSIPDGHGGSHGLQLIATGPPRKSNQPVVIFEAGFGSDAYEFASTMRLVAKMGIVRCFAYNRMGMQESELRSDFREEFVNLMKKEEEAKTAKAVKESVSIADVDTKENSGPIITAQDCARELSALLVAAEIPGPYIIASHSWGGISMCQFLALKNPPIPLSSSEEAQPSNYSSSQDPNDRVVGMIFIDANQESSHDNVTTKQYMAVDALIDPIDQNALLDYEARCVRPGGMTQSEWAKCNDGNFWPLEWKLKKQIMMGGMFRGWDESINGLKSHQILKRVENGFEPALTFIDPVSGRKKGGYVSALFGKLNRAEAQLLYDEVLKMNLGAEEERALMRHFIEDRTGNKEREMQKGFMKLAWEGRGRFLDAEKSAHNIQRTEPDLVASEIKWMVEELLKT